MGKQTAAAVEYPGKKLRRRPYRPGLYLRILRQERQPDFSAQPPVQGHDYGRVTELGLEAGFPSDGNAAFTIDEPYIKNFYDGYDGATQLNLTTNPQYRGKLRRSETKILDGGSTWLKSTLSYDTHGRLTAQSGNNY